MQEIHSYAFYNCKGLVSINIAESVDVIASDAFKGCSALRFLQTPATSYAASYFAYYFPNVHLNGTAYLVTFYSEGKTVTTGIYGKGDPITAPKAPVRADYTFAGWYKNAACTNEWDFDTDTMPSRPLSLYAGWDYTPAGFTTRAVKNGVAITGYTGSAKQLVIPEVLDGDPVVALDARSISSQITSVTLPASLQTISADAFRMATSLAKVECDEDNEEFMSEDGVLYSADMTKLLYYPVDKRDSTFEVPDGVEEIQAEAFRYNGWLLTLKLPDGLRVLGDGCFENCANLAEVDLPDTVDQLGKNVFAYCYNLKTLHFASDPSVVSAATFANSNIAITGPVSAVKLPAAVDLQVGNDTIWGNYNMYILRFYMDGELKGLYSLRAGTILGTQPLGNNDFRVYDGWSLSQGGEVADLDHLVMPQQDLSLYAVYHIPFTTRTVQGGVALVKYTGKDAEIEVPEVINGVEVISIDDDCFSDIANPLLKGNKGSVADRFAASKGLSFTAFAYTLRREANGGTPMLDIVLAATEALPTEEPTREGYTFGGWYTDAALTKALAFTAMPAKDTTLYAAWKKSGSAVVDVPFTFKRVSDGLAITGYTGGLGSVTLPNRINGELVTEIAAQAFMGNETLMEFTIPSSVKRIGEYAFSESRLGKITIANSVTEIGAYAFANCYELSSVSLGTGLTSLGEGAFAYCESITSIKIPSKVKTIPIDAFYGCLSLAEVTLPSQLTTIESGAFTHCEGIQTITIPANVKSVADGAFAYCLSLESIRVGSGNTSYKALNNVLFSYDGSELCLYPAGKTVNEYDVPDGVRMIRDEAMTGVQISTLNLNAGLEYIGNGALKDSELVEVNLAEAESLEVIGSSAFAGCTGLTEIVLPDSGIDVYENAFAGCGNLLKVTIPENVYYIGNNAIPRNRDLIIYTFGDSSGELYAQNNGISYRLMDQVKIQTRLTMVPEMTLRIQVKPENPDLTWESSNSAVAVVTDGAVTAVGVGTATISARLDGALMGTCKVEVLENKQLCLPKQLTVIAKEAFTNGQFTVVICGDNVKKIEARAFADNSQLVLVKLPDNITSIAADAFANCSNVVVECTAGSRTAVLLQEMGVTVLE